MKQTKNSSLQTEKTAKNDEVYTQMIDIEKEVAYYRQHFKDKVVYCNCDDPRTSNFFLYFLSQFETLGLKKLIAVGYNKEGKGLYSEYDSKWDNNKVPDIKEIQVIEIEGDGDFRSAECISVMEEADIVVTHPPLSLFEEYVEQLVALDRKFLLIGGISLLKHKGIFNLIKNNQVWAGSSKKHMFFIGEKKYVSASNACWFTNLTHSKRNEERILYKNYTPEKYPTYDNYNAIEVDKVTDIPVDYDGVMGVPITYLVGHNAEQFEIVGFKKGNDGKDLSIKGSRPCLRILIKKIKQNEN